MHRNKCLKYISYRVANKETRENRIQEEPISQRCYQILSKRSLLCRSITLQYTAIKLLYATIDEVALLEMEWSVNNRLSPRFVDLSIHAYWNIDE